MVVSALLVVASYLIGSIPAAYVASRRLRDRDLRRYGSGTISGSMVWEHVGRWAIVPVGLFDIGKAAFPTWLGLRLDLGMPVAVGAGFAALVGHNWSLYLRLSGGRGLGCFAGIMLIIFPWGSLWMLVFLAVGWRLGDSAPWALASLVTLPALSHVVGGPAVIPSATAAMVLLTLAKRLEANRRSLPGPGPERRRVILRRLFLDRDIPSHRDWVQRRPDQEAGRPDTQA